MSILPRSQRSPDEVLPAEAIDRIKTIGHADIVAGIPSYNNAATIGHVVRAVQAGLAKYFPSLRSIVINSDGGSRDGTPDVVHNTVPDDAELLLLSHPLYPIHLLTFPYHGIPGKGSAFRCIFRAAERLGARACVVVDSDLRSITPEWIQLLAAPILEHEFDYVAPYYLRHKYDGTITNSIVYPLTRALYGRRLRQPIGGDFGVSGRLASHYLTKPVWETDVARYGIDIWMTTTALAERFRVCQSFLGAKIHDAKDPGADLSDMLVQVVGTVFALMETYSSTWMDVTASSDLSLFGFRYDVGLEPVAVDPERMLARFRHGVENLRGVWKPIINAADLAELERLTTVERAGFQLEDEVWVRVVYDFAVAFHRRLIDRDHLVRSILPLYLGWVSSFVQEVADCRAPEVDDRLEYLSRMFESLKPYLTWRWAGHEATRTPRATNAERAGYRRDVVCGTQS